MDKLPMCACDEFYDDHHPECPVRREIENLRSKLDDALDALAGLVAVKGYKDRFGEDAWYYERQSKAWMQAQSIIDENARAVERRGECVCDGDQDEHDHGCPLRAEEGLGPAAAGVATRDTEKPGSGNDYTGKPRSCCGSDHRGREHGPQCALPDGYPECEHSILYTLDFANQPQRLDRCLFCELGEARRLLDEDLALYGKGTPQPMDVLKAAHDRIVGTDSEEQGQKHE